MGKVDYDQIYSLRRQINSHQSSINAASSAITSIEEKLGRLRNVKSSIVSIQQEVSNIKFSIKHKNNRPGWEGKNKDTLNTDWDGFISEYETFQRELDTYFDSICDEITRLENQQQEQNGIIGWCYSQINSLGNMIEKLFHTKEG